MKKKVSCRLDTVRLAYSYAINADELGLGTA